MTNKAIIKFSLRDYFIQLSKLHSLLLDMVECGERIDSFCFYSPGIYFLDLEKLDTYLTETNIQNTGFLVKIAKKGKQINSLWYNKVRLLPNKILPENEQNQEFIMNDGKIRFLTRYYFNCYVVIKGSWMPRHVVPEWKEEFFKLKPILKFSTYELASLSLKITSSICTFFPEILAEIPKDVEVILFENNFDNVPEKKVQEYFTKNLVDNNYLSPTDLDKYLKCAFEKMTPPKIKFKFTSNPTKTKITKFFNKYHKEVSSGKHGQKPKYVELLGEYFEGYNTETLISNWSR